MQASVINKNYLVGLRHKRVAQLFGPKVASVSVMLISARRINFKKFGWARITDDINVKPLMPHAIPMDIGRTLRRTRFYLILADT